MAYAPVAVVGAGLGGLSAAIHLRIAGHEVRVFEANSLVGGRANLLQSDGFQFDTGPSLLNYPWVFERLFAAAGRSMADYVELLPVDPSVSFQWPDGTRLSLSSETDRLVASFSAVEPGCGPAVLAFMRDAGRKYDMAFSKLVTRNADTPWEWFRALTFAEMTRLSVWRSLYGELRRFFRSPRICEALGAYGMYLGGSPYQLPGFFSILAYGELAYGLWLPKGGVYGLVRGLERLATELGVVIETNARVERIETSSGRVNGIRLATGACFDAPLVVSNMDVPATDNQLLAGETRLDARRARHARTRMTPGVLTFYWGVRGRLPDVGHHTIFLPDAYRESFDDLINRGRIPRGLPFYISVASETDPGLAPAGDSTVFVLVPTPVLSQLGPIDWHAETARIRSCVLERLSRHGVEITPDRLAYEAVHTPVDWRDRFGLHDGSAFGAAHSLFQLGPFRARNYAPELPGMYYVGASTTPGAGMPMAALSGKLVAERIGEHVRQPTR